MAADDQERLDPAVVAAMYARYGEQLKRFLLGLLRDAQLANDALQATFVKMVEQGHRTREESRKAWLFRVAYCEAMQMRRRQAIAEKATRKLAWLKAATAHSAEAPAVRFEAVQLVRRAVAELPARQRQIVYMRIYQGKTFAVIADELNIPLGTALARMRRALAKLRQKLQELEQD